MQMGVAPVHFHPALVKSKISNNVHFKGTDLDNASIDSSIHPSKRPGAQVHNKTYLWMPSVFAFLDRCHNFPTIGDRRYRRLGLIGLAADFIRRRLDRRGKDGIGRYASRIGDTSL